MDWRFVSLMLVYGCRIWSLNLFYVRDLLCRCVCCEIMRSYYAIRSSRWLCASSLSEDGSCQQPMLNVLTHFWKMVVLIFNMEFCRSIFGKMAESVFGGCALVMVVVTSTGSGREHAKVQARGGLRRSASNCWNAGWKPRRMPGADQCMQEMIVACGRPRDGGLCRKWSSQLPLLPGSGLGCF